MTPSACAVVLFDGVCNLCNAWVDFIIARDPQAQFRFAALQSRAARPYLERCRLAPDFLQGIVLVDRDGCHTRSTAALRVLRRLGGRWTVLYALIVVPRPLRDAVYDWIISYRYRWFGRRDACRLPSAELASRFLDPSG
jgi:predicted DCC family thiol-disulfide oxidoreductase YuxK